MPGALGEAHQPAATASLSSSSSPQKPQASSSSASASASASTSTKAPRRSLSFKRLRSRSRVQAEDVKVGDGIGVAADVAAVNKGGKSPSVHGGGNTAAPAVGGAATASSSLRPALPATTKSAQGRLEGGATNTAAASVTAAAISNHLTAASISPSAMPFTIPTPPSWPKTAGYCACYCEENAYLLAQDLVQRLEKKTGRGGGGGAGGGKVDKSGWRWDVWVVVVSNEGRMVLLWQQKASTSSAAAGHPVVWDYHVFVVVTAEHQSRAAQREREATTVTAKRPTTAPEAAAAAAQQPADMAKLEKQPSQRRRRANSLFRRRKATAAPPLPNEGRAGFSFDGTFIPAPAAPLATSEAARSDDGWHAWVYDADSVLCWRSAEEQGGAVGAEQEAQTATATPIPFTSYISQTFGPPTSTTTPTTLLPTFRLVRAEAFLDNFSSDRSHMLLPPLSNGNGAAGAGLDVKSRYTVAPPAWKPIVGPTAKRKGWGNNLMTKWVDMSAPPNEAAAEAAAAAATNGGEAHGGGGAPDLRVQFGKVMDRHAFSEGRWEMPEWRRTAKGGVGGTRRGPVGVGIDGEEQPPSIERVSSYHEHRRRRQRSASAPGNAGKDGGGEGNGPGGAVVGGRGGRVTSPLFPAYLHDVLQARATRKRDSYLALKVAARDGDGVMEGEGEGSADTKVNGRA